MDVGKILIGSTIAVATGAVLGVLFAPDKGSNMRKKLNKQAARYIGTLEKQLDEIKETADGITDKMKGAIDAFGSLTRT